VVDYEGVHEEHSKQYLRVKSISRLHGAEIDVVACVCRSLILLQQNGVVTN
jgi:hypothetical protein